MARGANSGNKVVLGKRKSGNAKKSYNKHTSRPKKYRGQGRT